MEGIEHQFHQQLPNYIRTSIGCLKFGELMHYLRVEIMKIKITSAKASLHG
jgi:hypothetical protein